MKEKITHKNLFNLFIFFESHPAVQIVDDINRDDRIKVIRNILSPRYLAMPKLIPEPIIQTGQTACDRLE